ncbi:MAG: GAF domain-containing protein [Lysobacter sp.]|nr:GAF domain-containing protein [Lysobacter sp.]
MSAASIPQNEDKRLAALHALLGANGIDEKPVARYTRIARSLAGTPVAALSLVDSDRQLFRGCAGEWLRETSRTVSFCAHALLEPEHLYVPDARLDPRFANNPVVTGDPQIRFYAGFPLFVHDKLALGALCLIDFYPRVLAPDQIASLRDLADCLQRELLLQILLREHAGAP